MAPATYRRADQTRRRGHEREVKRRKTHLPPSTPLRALSRHRTADFRIIHADVIAGLRTLPDASVNCCVTSPPYWGLRDYGTAKWEGGARKCDHVERSASDVSKSNRLGPKGFLPADNAAFKAQARQFRDACGKCGARRIDAQLGLERTPEEYTARLVDVFREVRRVLRDDGTLWLNIGDSYAGSCMTGGTKSINGQGKNLTAMFRRGNTAKNGGCSNRDGLGQVSGLKPKDLCGIPWRVAFALQADGWYLRSDIIWHKPNPMPESVRDRPTKAHEYLFLLAKSQRYYYDAAAIAEESAGRELFGNSRSKGFCLDRQDNERRDMTPTETRNKRTVWTVASQPYKGAHFATFPPKLIEPCILAGCPEGGTVLDPFNGSGTTGVVSLRAGRNYIGIELNPAYVSMARARIKNDAQSRTRRAVA